MKAEASWDSTVHECPQLSRGGAWPEQRVYLTVRVVVQLSHPADMQLVLRKRICVNVNPGRQGFAHNFLRRMSTRSTIPGCGVTFEVVSNIPGVRLLAFSVVLKNSSAGVIIKHVCHDVLSHQDAPGSEDREMLARLAANAHNSQSADNEAAIEKYLRSVLSLENILTLDRLRQVEGETGRAHVHTRVVKNIHILPALSNLLQLVVSCVDVTSKTVHFPNDRASSTWQLQVLQGCDRAHRHLSNITQEGVLLY